MTESSNSRITIGKRGNRQRRPSIRNDRALATGALEGANRALVAECFAFVLHQCGFARRATRALEEALDFYKRAGDTEHAAQVCWMLGGLKLELGDADGHLEFAHKALELVHDDPASLAFFAAHVELMRRYAAHYWNPALAQEHATQALRAAYQTPPGSVISLIEMQMALNAFLGRPAEARALAEHGVERATRDGDLLSAIRCWSNFAAVMEGAGETEQSEAGAAQALELIQRSGLDSLTGYWAIVELAHAKFNRGDLHAARELVDRLLAANIELPTFRLYVARVGIPVGLRLDLDELVARCSPQHLVDHALHASVPAIVGVSASFAEGLEASGKIEAARSLLGKAIDMLERTHAQPPPGDADLLLLAVAKYGADADVPRARAIFERVVRDSSVHSSPAFFALFEAHEAWRSGDRERAETKANEQLPALRKSVGLFIKRRRLRSRAA